MSPGNPTYAYYQGTSMAAPQVAGAVAQLLSVQPSLTPAQLEARLKATARVVSQCSATDCGAGILDAAALLTTPPTWVRLPGAGRAIGVGANGTAWLLGQTATAGGYAIYRWSGKAWSRVSGGAVSIDVDQAGNAWIVNNVGAISRRSGSGWQSLSGAGRDIGVGANGTAWLIGRSATAGGYAIYRWTGKAWSLVPGGAVGLDVDQSGKAWIVNNVSAISRYVGS